jgi:hypothetical protein
MRLPGLERVDNTPRQQQENIFEALESLAGKKKPAEDEE